MTSDVSREDVTATEREVTTCPEHGTMPYECEHGVTVDAGDFGPCQDCSEHGPLDCPNVTRCPECDAVGDLLTLWVAVDHACQAIYMQREGYWPSDTERHHIAIALLAVHLRDCREATERDSAPLRTNSFDQPNTVVSGRDAT